MFKTFKESLVADYETCWWTWKIEWKPRAGLHAHILGDLDGNPDVLRATHLIKKLWDFCCAHESKPKNRNFKSVVVYPYKEYESEGYLLKKINAS